MSFKVDKISKSFGSKKVIDEFSFQMEENQILIIKGASGSGKTTFLRLINNLSKVDSGSISINDTYLVKDGKYIDPEKYQKLIGLVFQDYQLFPNLTIMENLLLAPLSNNVSGQNILREKALGLLNRMDLVSYEDNKPSQLSGGQKQRVAIARSMMMNPALLCFDEPTSALDNVSVARVANLIKSVAKDGRMTIIITHDQALVDQFDNQARIIDSDSFKLAV